MPGIADYDRIAARSPRGEREALAPYVAGDEPLVSRHWAMEISGEDGTLLTKSGFGLAIFTTDRQAIVVGSVGGLVKPKYKVLVADYARCESGVVAAVREMFGRPAYLCQIRFTNGDTWLVRFHEREGMEAFSSELSKAITGYRIIHGLE